MSSLKNSYLILYNSVCCIGWTYILSICLQHISVGTQFWGEVAGPLKVFQTAAGLEILHAACRLVRSPLLSTLLQVSSRLFCVWLIVNISVEAQSHWGVLVMVLSWSCVEVPRYLFYALNLINQVPSWLFFLRYHLFMVLYPSGVTGEVVSMLNALPFFAAGNYAIRMPNAHNISISMYTIVGFVLITYIPGLPVMYSHMLKQRKGAYAKLKKQ